MREELVISAVSFLQDPTVAASPLEKRVAFLRSKNLTQEEIDAALRRVGENSSAATLTPASTTLPSYSPPPSPQTYSSGYYAPQQQAPPLPGRDWRDWFVMATVTSGVGYGLYYLTKRYVVPLIAPPTPPQLESDKAEVDKKFTEAFDILESLKTDTAALKVAEEERKTRVDAALEEVESVVQNLKDAGKRREDESKRVGDEVRGLRDLIPKALEGQKESQKKALEDLQTELKSLKQLVMNRTAAARPNYIPNGTIGTPPLDPGNTSSSGAGPVSYSGGAQTLGSAPASGPLGSIQRKDSASPLPFGGVGGGVGGKPAIPAWQMAARAAASSPAGGTTSNANDGSGNADSTEAASSS